jgi:hypothetical protein
LEREEDEGRISFKILKTYFPMEPSLHNFFQDASSVVDITKIVKNKKIDTTRKKKKIEKEEDYTTLFEDER